MSPPNAPLISIGLPVFNGAAYLAEALDSILAQDFEDFELILCDNGSTDATLEICARYVAGDSRVRFEGGDVNRGAAWNYNRAVDLARGRYFRWMTHDDRLRPTCVRRCLEVLLENLEDTALVYPRTVVIDADGQVTGEYDDRSECLSPRPHERIRRLLRNLSLCNAVLGLVPTDVLRSTRRIGSWPASDKTLLVELALRGKIREVPEPLFERRRDPSLPSPSNMTPEERAKWFGAGAGRRGRHRTVLVRETMRAVGLAPLGLADRLRCRATVVRDGVRHRREILRECKADLRRRFRPDRRITGSASGGVE